MQSVTNFGSVSPMLDQSDLRRALETNQNVRVSLDVMRPLTWVVTVLVPSCAGAMIWGGLIAQVVAIVVLGLAIAHFGLTYARWARRDPDRLGTTISLTAREPLPHRRPEASRGD